MVACSIGSSDLGGDGTNLCTTILVLFNATNLNGQNVDASNNGGVDLLEGAGSGEFSDNYTSGILATWAAV